MIEERKRMMHYRSFSTDSLHQRSRTASHEDADIDDEDFQESDSNVTKRRIRKKKKQPQQHQQTKENPQKDDDEQAIQNFDNLRRRLSR